MNQTHNLSLLIARLVLGTIIAVHGAQKLFGWFGGYGFEGSASYFTDVIGLPYFAAVLIILAESIGMIALIAGLFSRLLSVSLIIIMAGAIISHGQYGFFMNWSGTQGGEGIEYHLLVIGLSSIIALSGAGQFSLDALIHARLREFKSPVRQIFQ